MSSASAKAANPVVRRIASSSTATISRYIRRPMLQALLVTFREGIESFLIVGVVIAYLKKSGRAGLVRGVKIGLAISVVSCTAGAWLWLQVPNQPLYEGIAALTASVVVGALLWQMLHMGRHLRSEIEARGGRGGGARRKKPPGGGGRRGGRG